MDRLGRYSITSGGSLDHRHSAGWFFARRLALIALVFNVLAPVVLGYGQAFAQDANGDLPPEFRQICTVHGLVFLDDENEAPIGSDIDRSMNGACPACTAFSAIGIGPQSFDPVSLRPDNESQPFPLWENIRYQSSDSWHHQPTRGPPAHL